MEWILEILTKHTDENGVINIDDAVKEINSTAPKYTVPKDVYNTIAKEKKEAEAKLKDYEDAQLTEAQKQQKLIDDANAEKEKYQKMSTRIEVEKILLGAGMSEEDYKDFIDGIVTTDNDASKAVATAMANTFKAKMASAEEQAKNDQLKNTPRPNQGDGDNGKNKISEAEQFAKEAAAMGAGNEETKAVADYYMK